MNQEQLNKELLHASHASYNGRTQDIKLLLECGANINVVNDGGDTPLMCASRNGDIEIVKVLLEYGAKIDVVDSEGYTPLMWASKFGRTEIVELLKNNGKI